MGPAYTVIQLRDLLGVGEVGTEWIFPLKRGLIRDDAVFACTFATEAKLCLGWKSSILAVPRECSNATAVPVNWQSLVSGRCFWGKSKEFGSARIAPEATRQKLNWHLPSLPNAANSVFAFRHAENRF